MLDDDNNTEAFSFEFTLSLKLDLLVSSYAAMSIGGPFFE